MSGELITIWGVGVVLAGVILTATRGLRQDMALGPARVGLIEAGEVVPRLGRQSVSFALHGFPSYSVFIPNQIRNSSPKIGCPDFRIGSTRDSIPSFAAWLSADQRNAGP